MRELVLIFLVAAIVGTGAGLFAARQAAASPTSVSHCPCTIWDVSTTPALPTDPDPSAVELGVKFRSDSDGFITGIRFYKGPNNTGTHTGNLWSITGALLASATFTGETATGWQQVDFGSQVPITANTTYVASYHTTSGFYSVDTNYFAGSGLVNPPLQALAGGVDGPNGVYAYGSGGFPTSTWASANYWVDVVFIFDVTTDSTDPTVFITQPSAGDTVSGIVQVTASAFDDVGVAGVQFTLDGINLGVEDTLSPFSTFWDTDAGLNGAYNLSAVARDEAGNTGVAAAVGVTVSNPPILAITTPAGGANIVGGTVNVVYTVQGDQAEVDHVHFQLDGGPELADPTADGAHQVLNVGAGPHTLTGELARADHTTILGSDAAPVSFSVTIPDTIAPTSTITSPGNGLNVLVGNLVVITGTASDAGGGLVDGVDVSVDNGATWNGASGLENWSYQWVPAAEGQVTLLSRAVDDSGNLENPPAVGPTVTVGTDTTNPTVAITQPIAGDVVSGIVQVTASASDDVGVTGVQFMLDGFALDVEDTAPPFSASWDTGGAASGPHTLSAVASDAAGNTGVAPDVVVTVAEYVCPCSTWDASTTPSNPGPNGAELGVKFQSDVDGVVTGIRYYKILGNTGTNTGKLWSNTGALLASATFTGETAEGWQQVDFGSPVAIAANTTYVASYHTTSGVYSAEANYFNGSGFYNPPLRFLADGVDGPTGVYAYGAGGFPTLAGGSANYWVDVVYTTAPGFEIYAFDNTLTLGQSSVGNYDLGITGINGFFQAVTPTVSGLPPDTTGTFTPSVPPHPGPFALVVTTGPSAPPGTYQLVVSGASGGIVASATATLSLTITATPDFDLTLLPNSVTIQQGNSGVVTLQAGSLNNFNQPITLSASGLPAGVSVSFTPTTLTPTATGSLQVAVGAQVTPNTYQLTVTGIGGGITRQANLQLTVTLDSGTGSWQQLALGDIGALYYGAVVGDVGNTGQQRVYGTAADGVVYEYAFDGTSWSFSQVQVGVSADGEMHNGFIGPGREDGVNRLYIVAFNGNRLYEVTWANSSWQVAVVDSNIVGALDVDIGDGRNDGHTTVYATGDNAVYEYHWNGSGWDRTIISSSNGGHGLDLGPGRDDGVNRLYAGHLNGEIFEYTWTGSQWTSQLVANVGDIRGVEVGVGRNDGVQRLYAAAGNGNVYEFTWTGSSWQQVTLPGTGPGGLKVETILSPARGDGLVRIYVPAANGGIYEYGWTGSAWQSDLLGLANSYMYGAAAGDGLNNGGVQVYGASYDGNLYLFEFG